MSKHTILKQGGLKVKTNQRASILILSIVLLLAMLIASLNFFEQTADSIQISGYNRDSSESLLFAESAMNTVFGKFIFNGDLDENGVIDNTVKFDFENLTLEGLPYSFFISAGNGIDQALPSLLQRIANGEARNSGNTNNSSNNNNQFRADQTTLLIKDLFAAGEPLVFEYNAQNQLEPSSQNWSDFESSNAKMAIAWFELVRNTELDGTIQIYVQSVAKVGNSKSYVQRLVGNYSDTLGINVNTLSEASIQP